MATISEKDKIMKLSQAEYTTLSTTGTLTKDGVTYTYSPSDTIYVTPDESKHIYSTTEQVVGYWVDGKPLYEKVISFQYTESDKSSNSGWYAKDITSEIPNADTIFTIVQFMVNSNGCTTLPAFLTNNINYTTAIHLEQNGSTLYARTPNFQYATPTVPVFYLVVNYTKTTD